MSTNSIALLVNETTRVALAHELKGDVEVVIVSTLGELEASGCHRLIVEAALVEPAKLAAACRSIDATVLVAPDDVERQIDSLPDTVEIALSSSPPRLLARDIRRLVRSQRHEIDPLTRVPTRAAFWRQLQARTAGPGPHTLMFFDIDHFKRLNDTHGHLVGDSILRDLGARLAELAPPSALLARFGGEEFVIYLHSDAFRGSQLAQAVVRSFREEPCAEVEVRLSAGIATLEGVTEPEALVQRADEALYTAKARGRDRVVSYRELAESAQARDRDASLDAFESRTKVIAERVAEAITARGRRLFEDLQKRADVDPVTGLYSRGYLDRRLAFELDQARQKDAALTVALVDLDHFGEVNKTYGWPTGDEALRRVSDSLASNVRASDWVARYGGEELCVVMFGASVDDSRVVLERLVHVVSGLEIEAIDGRRFGLTVSIGAASLQDDEPATALLERASSCLLEAKRAGRNQLSTGN